MENFKLVVRLASVVSILWSVVGYTNGQTNLTEVACVAIIQYVLVRMMGVLK